jgi:hypothetical protein
MGKNAAFVTSFPGPGGSWPSPRKISFSVPLTYWSRLLYPEVVAGEVRAPPYRLRRPFFKKIGREKLAGRFCPELTPSGAGDCQVFWQNVRYFANPNFKDRPGGRKKKRLVGAI